MLVQVGKNAREACPLPVAAPRMAIRMIVQRQPAVGAAQFAGREVSRQVRAKLVARVERLALA